MNPLSLLPPPSNFFSDLPPLLPLLRNQHPDSWQQPTTNQAACTCPRVLYHSSPHRSERWNTLLLTLPAYQTRTSYTLYMRHDQRVSCRLFFFPFLFLNFFSFTSADFFLQPFALSYPWPSSARAASSDRVLSHDQRDKVPLPRRSRFLSCGKLVPPRRSRASLYYTLTTL